jgi:hypothetical protein
VQNRSRAFIGDFCFARHWISTRQCAEDQSLDYLFSRRPDPDRCAAANSPESIRYLFYQRLDLVRRCEARQRVDASQREFWLFFGDVKLDFTQAQLPPGETHIRINGLIGDVDVIAPTDVGWRFRQRRVR